MGLFGPAAFAKLPTDLRWALTESFSTGRERGYPTLVTRGVERVLSSYLGSALGKADTRRDCAEIFLGQKPAQRDTRVSDQAVQAIIDDAANKGFYDEIMRPDLAALAHHLNKLPPAKRAVLYYVLAQRYQAIEPSILLNTPRESNMISGVEFWLVDSDPFTGAYYPNHNSDRYQLPPKFDNPNQILRKLKAVFSKAKGITPNAIREAPAMLLELSFSGRRSNDPALRQSRLGLYYVMFRENVAPVDPTILEAIYESERLLGFRDPHQRPEPKL